MALRAPFEHRLLIDTGILTHDEIDVMRPRLYADLARGDANEEPASPVRFALVHDAYQLTPTGERLLAAADGAILIVRDPRDVAASLANHMRADLDIAIADMNDETHEAHVRPGRQHRLFRQRSRSWSGHARSWLEQTDLPVHLLRYEDMKADPVGAFSAALAFAGERASVAKVRRAVGFADFEALRAQEAAKGFCRAAGRAGRRVFSGAARPAAGAMS